MTLASNSRRSGGRRPSRRCPGRYTLGLRPGTLVAFLLVADSAGAAVSCLRRGGDGERAARLLGVPRAAVQSQPHPPDPKIPPLLRRLHPGLVAGVGPASGGGAHGGEAGAFRISSGTAAAFRPCPLARSPDHGVTALLASGHPPYFVTWVGYRCRGFGKGVGGPPANGRGLVGRGVRRALVDGSARPRAGDDLHRLRRWRGGDGVLPFGTPASIAVIRQGLLQSAASAVLAIVGRLPIAGDRGHGFGWLMDRQDRRDRRPSRRRVLLVAHFLRCRDLLHGPRWRPWRWSRGAGAGALAAASRLANAGRRGRRALSKQTGHRADPRAERPARLRRGRMPPSTKRMVWPRGSRRAASEEERDPGHVVRRADRPADRAMARARRSGCSVVTLVSWCPPGLGPMPLTRMPSGAQASPSVRIRDTAAALECAVGRVFHVCVVGGRELMMIQRPELLASCSRTSSRIP